MRDLLVCDDPIAERRYAYARAAARDGDWAAAAEVLEQALELAPNWAPAWFALGEARERLSEKDGATNAFGAALAADPSDAQGARGRLALLGEGSRLDALSPAHVARLFDDYAARFDAHLAGELGYRGPELIAAAFERLDSRRFSRCIDLGCGTGLSGAALRERVDTLIGVDLSPRMIAKARETGLYDSLEVGGAVAFLASQPTRGADLVVAADVLAYIGDLGPLFSAAGCALAPSGLLAVSVEAMDGIGNSRTFRMSPNSWRRSKSGRERSRPPEPCSAIRLPGPMLSSPTRKRGSMLSNSPGRSAVSIYRLMPGAPFYLAGDHELMTSLHVGHAQPRGEHADDLFHVDEVVDGSTWLRRMTRSGCKMEW